MKKLSNLFGYLGMTSILLSFVVIVLMLFFTSGEDALRAPFGTVIGYLFGGGFASMCLGGVFCMLDELVESMKRN